MEHKFNAQTPPTIDSLLYDVITLSDSVKAFLSQPGTNSGEKAAVTRTINQLISQLEKIREKNQ